MAKYSTGSSSSNKRNADVCEICSSTDKVKSTEISGASIYACKECINKHTDKKSKNNEPKNKKSWTNYATTAEPDNDWVNESRADYGNVVTPYLVQGYGKIFKNELQENNMSISDLSSEINLSESVLNNILESNAVKNNVSKKQITKIENYFNITLQD